MTLTRRYLHTPSTATPRSIRHAHPSCSRSRACGPLGLLWRFYLSANRQLLGRAADTMVMLLPSHTPILLLTRWIHLHAVPYMAKEWRNYWLVISSTYGRSRQVEMRTCGSREPTGRRCTWRVAWLLRTLKPWCDEPRMPRCLKSPMPNGSKNTWVAMQWQMQYTFDWNSLNARTNAQ